MKKNLDSAFLPALLLRTLLLGWRIALLVLLLAAPGLTARADTNGTSVFFSLRQLTGLPYATRMTLIPDARQNPVTDGTHFFGGLPISANLPGGTNTLRLQPIGYTLTVPGWSRSLHLQIPNTNGVVNAINCVTNGLGSYNPSMWQFGTSGFNGTVTNFISTVTSIVTNYSYTTNSGFSATDAGSAGQAIPGNYFQNVALIGTTVSYGFAAGTPIYNAYTNASGTTLLCFTTGGQWNFYNGYYLYQITSNTNSPAGTYIGIQASPPAPVVTAITVTTTNVAGYTTNIYQRFNVTTFTNGVCSTNTVIDTASASDFSGSGFPLTSDGNLAGHSLTNGDTLQAITGQFNRVTATNLIDAGSLATSGKTNLVAITGSTNPVALDLTSFVRTNGIFFTASNKVSGLLIPIGVWNGTNIFLPVTITNQ